MNKILTSILFLLVFTLQVKSQESIKKEKIKELFKVMHQDSLMQKTMDVFINFASQSFDRLKNDGDYQKEGHDFSKLMKEFMDKNKQHLYKISRTLLDNDMVEIYDKNFSMEEIDDFTNFYKTPSGQKMLMKMPGISNDIMNVMQTKYLADYQKSMMKDLEEIKEKIRKNK
jgi:uncharacterized protein